MLLVSRQLVYGLILAAACGFAGRLHAEEPVFEFLHAAQDAGYGEVAIDYLEGLRAGGRLPKELAETLDLELSRSFRIAVSESFNATEAEQRVAKAQTHLDKFLKEHADHPEVGRAIESWGDIALDRAVQRMRLARGTKDKAQKEKYLTAARADLEEARPRFFDATARYLGQLKKLNVALAEANKKPKSVPSATKKQRQAEDAARDAEIAWLEARFKSAKVDFYLGQTYTDPKSRQRKASLVAAAKSFDAIFQSYRESLVGLHAHLWHGRAADEMGNDQLALDIYDEVLATAPEGRERETGLEPLFAQVQYHRLLVTVRKKGTKEFLADANPWLQLHRTWKKFDGYQGVALEVAKAHLHAAAELNNDKKATQIQSALTMLGDIGKIHGEHQQEAILLRREYLKSGPPDPLSAKTFDEAVALADSAVELLDWPAAVVSFSRALELSSPIKDPKRIDEVQNRLDQARYHVAAGQFSDGKFEECISAADTIVRDRPESPLAPAASSLAVSAALSLYAKAQDKQASLERLSKIAGATIERWPDKAEADDARIALGQANLVRGELVEASEVFQRVNPRSQRYPVAMYLAGQTHWRLYLAAKARPEGKRDPEKLVSERALAEEQLRISLAAQRKDAEPGKPLSKQMLETQLLLGEVRLEEGQANEAAELLEPLLQWVRTEKPNPLDNTALRVYLAAARAEVALGEFPKVAAAAHSLIELGTDNPPVNGVLNSMLKMLGDGWKQAEAAAIEARTAADPMARSTAEAAVAERKDLLGQLLAKLATRKQNTLAAMIYIADTAGQLGQPDTARELYQAILVQAEQDPAFKQANGQALTRIQAQLVGLLRQKGQYAEGLAQVDKLIQTFPNALEPKMEKGRLLQSWADVDPAHFSEAVAHWTMLRMRLARIAKRPPEYYEVVYNAASCLFTESLKTKNEQQALQAEQLLNATLVLNPHLDGPEMVAKYKELLQKVRQLQGRPVNTSAKS
ncbi:MAG: hypothetical protein HY288_02935 [Planctomycetia bacterium]|nr:hypothetical protein [Planctomycetia bacterium]